MIGDISNVHTWLHYIILFHSEMSVHPLSSQMSPENQPTDRLDGLALSILQEIESTATTGTYYNVVSVFLGSTQMEVQQEAGPDVI